MTGVWKWLARYDRIEMFCALAAARSAGDSASTQLKQKNITVSTIMLWAMARMPLLLRSACGPYTRFWSTAKAEMIGEWLKENTITGIASHKVLKNAGSGMPSLAEAKKAPFQLGIRLTANSSRAATNGYTSTLMALTITPWPQRTMAIRPRISTSERIARGGGAMCSWCSMKLLRVLVSATLYTSKIGKIAKKYSSVISLPAPTPKCSSTTSVMSPDLPDSTKRVSPR